MTRDRDDNPRTTWRMLAALVAATGVALAHAQPVDPPAGFALIGHIEKFTLDAPGVLTSGAKVTVRGIEVVLPANLIITMPGGYLSAEQLFRGRDFKTPETPRRTGLALAEMNDADLVCPPALAAPGKKCALPAAEIELVGNIIGGRYIAGTARISQGGLHIGGGFIRSIDSSSGFFTVGADAGTGTTARLRLNDPQGVYGPRPDPTRPDRCSSTSVSRSTRETRPFMPAPASRFAWPTARALRCARTATARPMCAPPTIAASLAAPRRPATPNRSCPGASRICRFHCARATT